MRISVVIPTYSRPEALHGCLTRIAEADYDRGKFEVIVVDDGSPDPANSVVQRFASKFNVVSLRQTRSGPGAARNRGAEHARGEWLGFLDDDCVPRPDWLLQMDAAAMRDPEAMLGGNTINGCPGNTFAAFNQFLTNAVTERFRTQGSSLSFFPSNNLFVPAKEFRAMGGFHPDLKLAGGEDRELGARWLSSGRKLIAVEEAKVVHYHPQTLATFFHTHLRYGRGAAQLHRARMTSPWGLETGGLQASLLRSALGAQPARMRVAHIALLAIAQAAELAGYAMESLKNWPPQATEQA